MAKAVVLTESGKGLAKGLGRGLSQLMNGQEVAGKSLEGKMPSTEAQTIKVEFGRGLTTLVSAEAPAKEEQKKILLPAWFFFAADIVLLAFAVAVCFDASGSFDLGRLLFSFASVSCAGVLGLMGIKRAASDR